jgi:nitrogen fixation protein NifU and related proteins
MSLLNAYKTIVLEHNRAPRRRGRLVVPSVSAEGVNVLCGDRLNLELQIEGETLVDFAFEAEASALTLAACSIMGDLVCGRSLADAGALVDAALDLVTRNPQAIENPDLGDFNCFLGVLGYPNRIKTVTLPWATLAGALAGRLSTSTDVEIRGAAVSARSPSSRSP